MKTLKLISKSKVKNLGRALALSMSLIGTLAQAAPRNHSPAPVDHSVSQMPNGYGDGLPNAIYGTYTTPVQPSAKVFQDQLALIERKAYGLPAIQAPAGSDPALKEIQMSEAIYVLENEIIRINRDIANSPKETMTDFERKALLFSSARAYEAVRHHAERIYEDMIRFIDVKLPGPNGLQIREELNASDCLYTCNYRTAQVLSAAEQDALYKKKLASFLAEGGSLLEIHRMTPEFAKTLGGYSRFEYTWLENGDLNVTPGKAGHILLAEGKVVKSAGQIVLVKSDAGEITMAIVTNGSGSYKPDLLSAQQLADHLARQLNIPEQQVIITKGEPVSTQAVSVYLKGLGTDKAIIKKRVSDLEAIGKSIMSRVVAGSAKCANAFGN